MQSDVQTIINSDQMQMQEEEKRIWRKKITLHQQVDGEYDHHRDQTRERKSAQPHPAHGRLNNSRKTGEKDTLIVH